MSIPSHGSIYHQQHSFSICSMSSSFTIEIINLNAWFCRFSIIFRLEAPRWSCFERHITQNLHHGWNGPGVKECKLQSRSEGCLGTGTLLGPRMEAQYCSSERKTTSRRWASKCASLILLNILSVLPDCDFPNHRHASRRSLMWLCPLTVNPSVTAEITSSAEFRKNWILTNEKISKHVSGRRYFWSFTTLLLLQLRQFQQWYRVDFLELSKFHMSPFLSVCGSQELNTMDLAFGYKLQKAQPTSTIHDLSLHHESMLYSTANTHPNRSRINDFTTFAFENVVSSICQ